MPVVLDLLKSENEHKNIANNHIYINPITLKIPYSKSPKSLVFIHVWFVRVSTFTKFQIQQEPTIVVQTYNYVLCLHFTLNDILLTSY